jgi:hypothetical protein
MSDRALWLDERCPTCRTAPGARCRASYLSKARPATDLHIARGRRARSCPTCKALAGESCRTPWGREASRIHKARLRPGRREVLSHESVWQELEARGVAIATVAFSGRAGRGRRAGRGGRTERIVMSISATPSIGGKGGADRAGEFGRRNAVPGELLVRLRPERLIAAADVAGNDRGNAWLASDGSAGVSRCR